MITSGQNPDDRFGSVAELHDNPRAVARAAGIGGEADVAIGEICPGRPPIRSSILSMRPDEDGQTMAHGPENDRADLFGSA